MTLKKQDNITLRDFLKNQFKIDCKKNPKKIWNQFNTELKWDSKLNFYIGLDEKGKEWIAALQHTEVPIFSMPCPNLQRKENIETSCGVINFAPIFKQGEKIRCHGCNKEFTVKLNVPKTSNAYKSLANLDK